MTWIEKAAAHIARLGSGGYDAYSSSEIREGVTALYIKIIEETYVAPLLQCTDCGNTESPAGAMARQFNHGRCLHCGGFFRVTRA